MRGDLAERVRAQLATCTTFEERAAALGLVLHGEDGFRGNAEDYSRPPNSYLDWLLDLKKGIPISLSLLYVFVGRRAGRAATQSGRTLAAPAEGH